MPSPRDAQLTHARRRAPQAPALITPAAQREAAQREAQSRADLPARFGNAELGEQMGAVDEELSLPLRLHAALSEVGFPEHAQLFGASNEAMLRVMEATPLAMQALGEVDGEGWSAEQTHAAASTVGAMHLLRVASGGEVPEGVASRVERALSGGRPLPPALRARMEAAFGHAFNHVRVHTDGRAAQAAREVQAHAFTVGADIVFADGAFAPHTAAGQELIAHELTHVVQGDEGRLPTPSVGQGLSVSSPSDAHEREAYAQAAEVREQLSAPEGAEGSLGEGVEAAAQGTSDDVSSGAAQSSVTPTAAASSGSVSADAQLHRNSDLTAGGAQATEDAPEANNLAGQLATIWGQMRESGSTVTYQSTVIEVSDARTFNANAHTVTFLNGLRAALVAELARADEDGAAEQGENAPQTALPDADGSDNVAPTASPTEAYDSIVDAALVRLIAAYQVARGLGTPDGKVGSGTYGAIVGDFAHLSYQNPELKTSSRGGDFTPDPTHEDEDVMGTLSEAQRYDVFQRVISEQNGVFFSEPFFVNALGLRGVKAAYGEDSEGATDYNDVDHLTIVENTIGQWDDCIVAIWVDADGAKKCQIFGGTTDATRVPGRTEGNVMAEGQHLYREDTHQGSRASAYMAMGSANEALDGTSRMPGFRRNAAGDGLEFHHGMSPQAPTYDNIHTTHRSGDTRHEYDITQAFRLGSVTLNALVQGEVSGGLQPLQFAGLPTFWTAMRGAASSSAALRVTAQTAGAADQAVTSEDGAVYSSVTLSYTLGGQTKSDEVLRPQGVDYAGLVNQDRQVGEVSTTDTLLSRESQRTDTRPQAHSASEENPGNYSLGCQVIQGEEQFNSFMDLTQQGQANGQQVFPYTLVSGDTLKGVLDAVAAEAAAQGVGAADGAGGGPAGPEE